MEIQNLQRKFEKYILFFIIYTFTFLVFFKTLKYTLPFVLAFGFALILKFPTRFLMNKLKFKNWLASLLSTIIFFTLLLIILTLLILCLTSEIIKLSGYLQNLMSNNSSWFFDYISQAQDWVENLNINIDPSLWDSINKTFSSSFKTFISGAVSATTAILQSFLKALSYVPYIVMTIVFTLMSTYFFTKEVANKSSKKFIEKILPRGSTKFFQVIYHARKMILNYCLSYMILIFTSMFLTFIGFCFLKIDYALVLSIIAGLLDLLPIVGMAMIYIPLALFAFSSGNYFVTISLIALYALVCIVRQILEPKVISSSLGINPVASLAALFIGLQINGFSGVIFCMFLVVTYNILKKVEIL